jgi:hypothetical protein
MNLAIQRPFEESRALIDREKAASPPTLAARLTAASSVRVVSLNVYKPCESIK